MNKAVKIKKNEERRLNRGHLWLFSNEIDKITGDPDNGDLVNLIDYKENLIGRGFYNKNSLIAVRIITKVQEGDLREIFRERIKSALKLREECYPERSAYRLLFSESDLMPGLIIDQYNNSYVMQVYSYGMEKNINLIVDLLQEELKAENIFTRNESFFRGLEGLPDEDTVYLGEMKEEIIYDGKIIYKIDFNKGHKTGFYFDQSDNRDFIEKFCEGKRVLDAFCNQGGFGLHAIAAGAAEVIFLDSSAEVMETVKQNYELNNLSGKYSTVTGDVFDYLSGAKERGEQFDVVVIDPPAFAKSKKHLATAKKGYRRLNRLALDIIKEGGYLVTSSCSFHLTHDDFIDEINTAAENLGVRLQLVHYDNASLDHPKLPAMRETSYLKFAVLRKVKG